MTGALISGLVTNAMATLVAKGFDRVKEPAFSKALRGIFEAALTSAVDEISEGEDDMRSEHVASIFAGFLGDSEVVASLLDSTLGATDETDLLSESDVSGFRRQFDDLGLDPDTLPVSFDELVQAFVASMFSGLRTESLKPDSALFNARVTHMMEQMLNNQHQSAEQADRADAQLASVGDELRRLSSTLERGPYRLETDHQLDAVPPNVRDALVDRLDESWANRLLQNLANLDRSPAASLSYLVESPRDWLEDAGPAALLIIGEFAAAHGDVATAADAWERAGRSGVAEAGLWLCRAAMAIAGVDEESALALVDEAVADFSADQRFARFARAAIASDRDDVLASSDDFISDIGWVQTTVMFGRAEALILDERVEEAIATLEGTVRTYPHSAGMMIRLSGLIGARAVNEASGQREQQLRRAEELAVEARDERRRWRGPSGLAVAAAARAAFARGDVERVLTLTRAGEDGEALPEEAKTDEVIAETVFARLAVGDRDQASSIVTDVGHPVLRRELEAVVADAEGDDASAVEGYLAALESTDSLEQRLRIQMSLAFLRVSPVPGIDDTRRHAGDEIADRIQAMSAFALGDTADAVRVLRRWSESHAQSAALLADFYARDGEIDKSIAAYRAIHVRFGDPRSRVHSALLLYSEDRFQEAKEEAQLALGFIEPNTAEWRQLTQLLADVAWTGHEWSLAERHVRLLIDQGDQTPNTVWGLIALLFNQRKLTQAWTEYTDFGAPVPRTPDEIRLWADLAGRFQLSDETVQQFVHYVEEADDDEELASALLAASYAIGSQLKLSPETVLRRQAATDNFVLRFPDSGYFFRMQWSDADEMREILQSHLEPGASEFAERVREVFRTRQPVGVLAAMSGRTYLEALMLRSGLVIPLETADDVQREAERSDVEVALGGPIAVDPSVLSTASLIRPVWENVFSEFSELRVSEASALDIYRGADALSLRSKGHIGWDPVAQSITVDETDVSEESARIERSRWIADQTSDRFSVTPIADLTRFSDLDMDRFGSWLGAIELAARDGVAVMADDVVLRLMARQMGIPAFGTTAVLDVLANRGLLDTSQHDEALGALRAAYAVDMDFDPEAIYALAESENWAPGAASAVFTRTSAWRVNESTVVSVFVAILQKVSEADPQLLPHWLASGVLGSASGLPIQQAVEIAGRLLAGAIYDFAQERPELIPALVYATRSACAEIHIPRVLDPLSIAVPVLHDVLAKAHGARVGGMLVRKLLAVLTPDDQLKVLRALDMQ